MTTTEHGCGPMECGPRDLVQVWAEPRQGKASKRWSEPEKAAVRWSQLTIHDEENRTQY